MKGIKEEVFIPEADEGDEEPQETREID